MNFVKTVNLSLWADIFTEAVKKESQVIHFDPDLHMIYEGANTDNPNTEVLGVFYNPDFGFMAISFLIDHDENYCRCIKSEVCNCLDKFTTVTDGEKQHISLIACIE